MSIVTNSGQEQSKPYQPSPVQPSLLSQQARMPGLPPTLHRFQTSTPKPCISTGNTLSSPISDSCPCAFPMNATQSRSTVLVSSTQKRPAPITGRGARRKAASRIKSRNNMSLFQIFRFDSQDADTSSVRCFRLRQRSVTVTPSGLPGLMGISPCLRGLWLRYACCLPVWSSNLPNGTPSVEVARIASDTLIK